MKAQEQLDNLIKTQALSDLFESYQDSDWRFYLQLKVKQEAGVSKSFYSENSLTQLQSLNPEVMVAAVLKTCWPELWFHKNMMGTPEELVSYKTKPLYFVGDELKIEIQGQVWQATVSERGQYQVQFHSDFEPNLTRYQVKISLVTSGPDRLQFEKLFSDNNLKREKYLGHLKNQVLKALIREEYKFSRPKQNQVMIEIAEEIATRYGWDLKYLDEVLDSGTSLNATLWDFDIKDLALIRLFYKTLQNNSAVFVLLKANKINNIIAQELAAEQKEALAKLEDGL
jgi:hypothetical protein